MAERSRFFDDIAGVAGGALSAMGGLRDEITSLVRARTDEAIRRLNLVRREEFDAMADMLARARDEQEGLLARLASLEERITLIEAGRVDHPDAVHGDRTRD